MDHTFLSAIEPEFCMFCNHRSTAHVNGKCPRDTHINIDAITLDRVTRTGHPRLLGMVLADKPRTALADVHIDAIKIVEV